MADLLPINFPIPGEVALASYDWADYLEQVGYIKFYFVGLRWNIGGAGTNNYTLTRQSTPSHTMNKSILGAATTDFTTMIYSPIVLGGTDAIFIGRKSGADTHTLRAEVYKNSTKIGEIAEASATSGGAANYVFKMAITKTAFTINDVLKVRIITTAGGGGAASFDYDTESSAGGSYILIPTKINP